MSATEIQMIIKGIGETLYMTIISTLIGYVIGLPWGIGLTVTNKDGIHPNTVVFRILDILANIMRSIPFLIMLIVVIPITQVIVGKTYGPTAMIVPLTISAAPLIARMVESSLNEVDKGVIEAAQSMGSSNFQIVWKVMLSEAKVSLISGATITIATILGYSAMAGTLGGGGLGDIAIRYGYYRWQGNILITTVILLILLVQLFQVIGTVIGNRLDKRKR
ncbi:MAG: ABC transporter permease [Lachnospiraceae bacterium]|nr:ABC transporter permease [Lachnospiraceae bacterium]